MQPASTATQLPPIPTAMPATTQAAGIQAVKHKRERRVHKDKKAHTKHCSSKPPDLIKKPAVIN